MGYPKGKYQGKTHWNRGTVRSKPARKMTKVEIAWLAGLFDGEGCILNSKKAQGHFCLRIVIGMNNLEILSRVVEVTGCGTINKRGKPKQKNHAQTYAWQCHGANAASVLQQILPWLIVKQDKAIEMIAEYTITIDPA